MKLYIKERAKKRSISLIDIAKSLGLKSYPSFLRTIDNGENLKLKQLQIIADKLDCSIEDLMVNPDGEVINNVIRCPHCGRTIKFEKEEA